MYGVVGPFIPTLLREEQWVSDEDIQMTTSLIILGFGILDLIGARMSAIASEFPQYLLMQTSFVCFLH